MTVDELWDALREAACVTRPSSDAKRIVQLSKDDVKNALKLIKKEPK